MNQINFHLFYIDSITQKVLILKYNHFFSINAYKYYVIHSQLYNLMDFSSPQIAIMDNDEDTLNLFTDVINMQGYLVIGFVNPYFLIDYINEIQNDSNLF